MALKADSLKKRYSFKLLTNIVSLPISIITQSIIPRALGPVGYGNFGFLTNFFSQFVTFFDSGASTCFYTKLSQRQDDKGLVKFYFYFVITVSILLVLIVTGLIFSSARIFIWPEQEVKYIWMALFWGLINWYAQELQRMIDAYGLTVVGEIINIIQKFINVILILVLFLAKYITLFTIFLYNYAIILFLLVGSIVLIKKNKNIFLGVKLYKNQIKEYGIEFINYSMPLFAYSTFSVFAAILDRWFLQVFGGSIQQGYYWLSFQIGAICFIFTSAMTTLITREFSVAFSEGNKEAMRQLFQRFIPMLYLIAAYIAVFVAFEADKITILIGGHKFEGASTAIIIMSFYPIHQTYGQLSGSLFYATGQTKIYRNVGIIFTLISLPIMFFLIAPAKYYGLSLGAEGLATKMVALQFIAVNVLLWFNTKYLNLSFKKFVGHQIYTLIILAVLAYLTVTITNYVIDNIIISLIIGGLIYSLLFILVLYLMPSLGSTSRVELKYFMTELVSKITRQN